MEYEQLPKELMVEPILNSISRIIEILMRLIGGYILLRMQCIANNNNMLFSIYSNITMRYLRPTK